MQYVDFAGHRVSRIFKGNWQLSGGHGPMTREQALADSAVYVEHGVSAFDMGDIYTGAEETMGEFLHRYRAEHGDDAADKLRMHTKFVPDLNALEDLTPEDVRAVITRSCARLGLSSLPLVQFHWWDYDKGDYVAAAQMLAQLQEEGLIEAIGLTNFDTEHTQTLLDAGVPIVSNQIQFSLLDPRPFNGMLDLAKENNIAIFCYGVLAGGLLANSEPVVEETNRSHIKYGLMVDEFGEENYRDLLAEMSELARKHGTTVGNIATRYVLQTPGVSAVILGPRNTDHIDEMDELFDFKLSPEDYNALKAMSLHGFGDRQDDIYSFERDREGVHGSIMRYNLNGMRPDRA